METSAGMEETAGGSSLGAVADTSALPVLPTVLRQRAATRARTRAMSAANQKGAEERAKEVRTGA